MFRLRLQGKLSGNKTQLFHESFPSLGLVLITDRMETFNADLTKNVFRHLWVLVVNPKPDPDDLSIFRKIPHCLESLTHPELGVFPNLKRLCENDLDLTSLYGVQYGLRITIITQVQIRGDDRRSRTDSDHKEIGLGLRHLFILPFSSEPPPGNGREVMLGTNASLACFVKAQSDTSPGRSFHPEHAGTSFRRFLGYFFIPQEYECSVLQVLDHDLNDLPDLKFRISSNRRPADSAM